LATITGYVRVSTKDLRLSGQLDAPKAAGATTIYKERVSRPDRSAATGEADGVAERTRRCPDDEA
jgi:DNA invertase Pin-like site-specific DNA recombinase